MYSIATAVTEFAVQYPTAEATGISNAQSKIFKCPVTSCTMTFARLGNMMRHLEGGKHKVRPEKLYLADYAVDAYANQLAKIVAARSLPAVEAALQSIGSVAAPGRASHTVNDRMGWALSVRRVSSRLPDDVVTYLTHIFDRGIITKKKAKPQDVAERMQTELRRGRPRFQVGS